MAKTNRGAEWEAFSKEVLEHVEDYTVPQYGDAPGDLVETSTVEDIKVNLERYIRRIGKNARGPVEARRDALKIAHYACLLANKE